MVVSLHSLSPENGGDEERTDRRGDSTLKRMKQEIACVFGPAGEPGGRTRRVKGKKAILTMKSLILAQDER